MILFQETKGKVNLHSLHSAIEKGDLKKVRVLIANGANCNHKNNNCKGNTPLHVACQCKKGRLAIVKMLIANGANYNYRNNEGKTPIDVATIGINLKDILWSRYRSFMLTRPHDDHETNEEHQLTPLGQIVTVNKGDNPNSQDNLLIQIKIKVASFL